MKKHITVEQVWELAKNKNYWDRIVKFNTLANIKFDKPCNCFQDTCKITAEQTTIGKMIEILGENNCLTLRQENIVPNDSDFGLKWVVEVFHDIDCPIKYYESEKLADALWKAVKKYQRRLSDER